MSKVKTVDPRGLEHHEREALIFPSIEELKKNVIKSDTVVLYRKIKISSGHDTHQTR